MSKKKWLLLFLCILLFAGYWKFFYKTYSETNVARSADCIFALDIKRVTNTVIWNTLTTPGHWKKISYSRSAGPGWKDMIKLPDYVFVFHAAGQPNNAWYSLFEIKNESDFANGLMLYHFQKGDSIGSMQQYFSTSLGISLIRSGNKLLIGNNAVEDKNCIRQVANEMFVQKQFAGREKLFRNVSAGSHLSILIERNDFLQDDAIVEMNFDKQNITIDAILKFTNRFTFTESNFSYPADGLCSTGFTQPAPAVYDLLPGKAKENLSKALSFNIDSLLLGNNHHYELNISTIAARTDSAISYVYDDNFNQVEKVVVNQVMEPAFNFKIHGDSISSIYKYWENHGQFEMTPQGMLFLPIPLVKSYCSKINEKELSITSMGYKNLPGQNSVQCIFFFKLLLTKIPPGLLRYLPVGVASSFANLESIDATFKKTGEGLNFEGRISKKDNDLPLLNF
ncbi:MAG: hypothetical protein ABIN36_13485 [Ferruginibacter sp.]